MPYVYHTIIHHNWHDNMLVPVDKNKNRQEEGGEQKQKIKNNNINIQQQNDKEDQHNEHNIDPKILKRIRLKPQTARELIRGIPDDHPTTLSNTFTAVMSGLICGVLAVTFNVVMALLTFDSVLQIAPIGVGCYHVTTIIAGLGALFFSSLPIAMGGPNIKHAILLSEIMSPIVCEIDPTINICAIVATVGTGSSTGSGRRMLLAASSMNGGGNSTSTSSSGNIFSETLSYEHEVILATTLFAMLYTTLIFAISWWVIGTYKLTRMFQFLPSFVTSGFIGSCGYLIIVKAIYVSTNMHFSLQLTHPDVKHVIEGKFWYLLVPALLCGGIIFASKLFKVVKVEYTIPLVLIVSMSLFFILIYTSGNTVETARDHGWFYQQFPQTAFYSQWVGLNVLQIEYLLVFRQTFNILFIWVILTVDALMQLVAIKRECNVPDMNFDNEFVLAGKYNLINTIGIAAPGYTLLKFTWENYHFVHNIHDKLPGLVYVSFVGASFFTGIPIVNVLPRFFLGALVIYTGIGFLSKSLVKTYHQVPMMEYCGIWAMVILTALVNITISVIIGFVFASMIFVFKYGRRSAIKAILTGAEYQSCVVRNHRDQLRLQHLGKLSMIIQLHRYLFFGSVAGVKDKVEYLLKARSEKHALDGKIKYLIIDFEHIDGVDVTSFEILIEIVKVCNHEGIVAIFTHLQSKYRAKLHAKDPKLFNGYGMYFDTQDDGAEYVEEALLLWAAQVRKRWLVFDSLKRLHGRHILQGKHEAFEEVLGDHSSDDIWKYIEKEEIKKGTELCIAGQVNHKLYVLQRGRLTSYLKAGDSHKRMTGALVRLHTMTRGAFVNEDSLYLDMPVPHTIVADRDSTVISITRDKLKQMEAENPEIAIQIMRTVLMHTATIRNTLEMEVNAVDHWEEVKTQRMQAKLVSENSSGMGLTQMINDYQYFAPEAMDLHVKSVGYDENQHYFHHLQLPQVEPIQGGQVELDLEGSNRLQERPTLHLSSHMANTVTECFRRHVSMSAATSKYTAGRFGLFGKLRAKQAKFVSESQNRLNESKNKKAAMESIPIENFLKGIHLSDYLSDLKKRGYDIVDDLLLAEDTEITELASSLKQSKGDTIMGSITPHKRRFISKINEMRKIASSSESSEDNNDSNNNSKNSMSGVGKTSQFKRPGSPRNNHVAPEVLTLYETLEALMDLGVFPTKKEIGSFIGYLKSNDAGPTGSSQQEITESLNIAARAAVASASKHASEIALSSDLVDPDFVESAGLLVNETQFLQLVEMLELKPLTISQINYFRNIFYEFADIDGALSSESLGHLMASIGHPESPLELQQLVRRWDIDGKGHIDFDNFVSMISCFLKKEEVEQEVEHDFAKFSLATKDTMAFGDDDVNEETDGNKKKARNRRTEVNEDSVITVDNILNLFRLLNIDITLDEAEEMIFEGDYNEDKKVTFHEFVDLITLIHDSELN